MVFGASGFAGRELRGLTQGISQTRAILLNSNVFQGLEGDGVLHKPAPRRSCFALGILSAVLLATTPAGALAVALAEAPAGAPISLRAPVAPSVLAAATAPTGAGAAAAQAAPDSARASAAVAPGPVDRDDDAGAASSRSARDAARHWRRSYGWKGFGILTAGWSPGLYLIGTLGAALGVPPPMPSAFGIAGAATLALSFPIFLESGRQVRLAARALGAPEPAPLLRALALGFTALSCGLGLAGSILDLALPYDRGDEDAVRPALLLLDVAFIASLPAVVFQAADGNRARALVRRHIGARQVD
jgi:hypothetical protein